MWQMAFRARGRWAMWALALTASVLLAACGGTGSVEQQGRSTFFDGSLYLAADDGFTGRELWITDGSAVGTHLVKNISMFGDSLPYSAVAMTAITYNGSLYFAATDDAHGTELWKSDGTQEGTMMVADIADAPDATASSNPSDFAVYNGLLYFAAENQAVGRELWRTDGTEAGTLRVKDINPGGDSKPAHLTVSNGLLWFFADNGSIGRELWNSNGTSLGTQPVKDLNPSGDGVNDTSGSGAAMVAVDGGVVFAGDNGTSSVEPAFSDGTPGKTGIIADLWSGGTTSFPAEFTSLGKLALFVASDGNATVGYELWATDGSTIWPLDIRPGVGSSFPYGLTVFNGAVYFAADDGTHGIELWRSDGTPEGTLEMEDIGAGFEGSGVSGLTVVKDRLYFFTFVSGQYHLWYTDGTPGGAVKVMQLPDPGYCLSTLGAAGHRMLFTIDSDGDTNGELWVTDGTADGTHAIGSYTVAGCGG